MYVDAKLIGDHVWVSERDKTSGIRTVDKHRPIFLYYEEDPQGDFQTITGHRARRVRCFNRREFERKIEESRQRGLVFETDISLVNRFLEEKYPGDDTPSLRVTIYDFEVDRDPKIGYADAQTNPYAPMISFSLYHKWLKQSITVAVPPPNLGRDGALRLCADADNEDGYGDLTEESGFILVDNEIELLIMFLTMIEDSDILSAWNGDFYDMVYLIHRIRIVLGGEPMEKIVAEERFEPTPASIEWLQKLNLFPCLPALKYIELYGRKRKVYQIFGRKHLDYQRLYMKFAAEPLHSYSLDSVLEKETSLRKIKYEGKIDEMYRNRFRQFLAYNKQDCIGMVAIDDKKRMIELANQMAHMSGVTIENVYGSVSIIEQAVLKELHQTRGEICFDRTDKPLDKHVPGAFVVDPKPGLYGPLCTIDAKSLYPSIIRCLNISPEMIVGQFDLSHTEKTLESYVDEILGFPEDVRRLDGSHRKGRSAKVIDDAYAKAWRRFTGVLEYHDLIEGGDVNLTLVFNDGNSATKTAREWKAMFKKFGWCISGNATVFDMERDGIIPHCLTKWYQERSKFRKEADRHAAMLAEGKKNGFEDGLTEGEVEVLQKYYDMVQDSKKRFLNSTYGAYLNRYFRFTDSRCGRSTTLSGRIFVKHMAQEVARILTGTYGFDERTMLYGDTDSAIVKLDWYMRENNIEFTDENAIAVANDLGKKLNESFSQFMQDHFLVTPERAAIMEASRELVGRRGLFKESKKRYAIHVIDQNGVRVDKMKIMGMEIRRTDTPRYMQTFLTECVELVVKHNGTRDQLHAKISKFRDEFRERKPWERGSPVRVSKLSSKTDDLNDFEERTYDGETDVSKPLMHQAVKAAINTNRMIEHFEEKGMDQIQDGDHVSVLYLRPNDFQIDTVAVKVEETYIPEWFRDLPFDNDRNEDRLITKKIDNIFGALGWNLDAESEEEDLFL